MPPTFVSATVEMSETVYRNDPCDKPSLNASIANVLLSKTPLHAWHAHPRLGNAEKSEPMSEQALIGLAAHDIIFSKGARVVVGRFDNYRSGEARAWKADAEAKDLIPLLPAQMGEANALVISAEQKLNSVIPGLLDHATKELVIIWKDDPTGTGEPVTFRTRIDCILSDPDNDTPGVILDYKTTQIALTQSSMASAIVDRGYDLAMGFHIQAAKAAFPHVRDWTYLFLFQERAAPNGSLIVRPTPDFLELGRRKFLAAGTLWQRCLATGVFPGYEDSIADLPPNQWAETRWFDREVNDAKLREAGYNPGVGM